MPNEDFKAVKLEPPVVWPPDKDAEQVRFKTRLRKFKGTPWPDPKDVYVERGRMKSLVSGERWDRLVSLLEGTASKKGRGE